MPAASRRPVPCGSPDRHRHGLGGPGLRQSPAAGGRPRSTAGGCLRWFGPGRRASRTRAAAVAPSRSRSDRTSNRAPVGGVRSRPLERSAEDAARRTIRSIEPAACRFRPCERSPRPWCLAFARRNARMSATVDADRRAMPPVAEGPAPSPPEIAAILVEAGVVSEQDVAYARRVQSRLAGPRSLVLVLQDLRLVTPAALRETLSRNRVKLRLGTLLLELGIISGPDLQAAVALQKEAPGRRLGEVLVENHFISEDNLLKVLSAQLGLPYLELDRLPADRALLERFKPAWFSRHQAYPFRGPDGALLLALADPLAAEPCAEASRTLGQVVAPCLVRRHLLLQAVRTVISGQETGGRLENESAQVQAVQRIISEAIAQRASDIHIEPMPDRLRVRFRQDGVLVQHADLPLESARALTSRIKV
ncbi:hypothetical protein FJ250_06380, partial [bacterium]|nr:hypothetical protein [bacterium]